jgi:O-antigen ligase
VGAEFVAPGTASITSPLIGALAATAVVISGLADLPGKWSLGASVTIAYIIWCWFPLQTRLRELRRLWSVLYPFLFFCAWAVISFAWQRPVISGLENLAVLLVFLGLILHCSDATSTSNCSFSTALAIAVWGASVLYAVSLLLDGPGSSDIIGARIYGLFVLVGISWYAAHWSAGVPKTLGCAIVLLFLLALSLSRMALVVGVFLVLLASLAAAKTGKRLRLIAVALLLVTLTLTAISRFGPLAERFGADEVEQASVEDASNVDINTNGRLVMWALVWQSYLDSPWIGKGAGSAAGLLESTLTDISHPHCDYLMLLHDYGIVGFALFLLGLATLLACLWKTWRISRNAHRTEAPFLLATLLLLVAMMGAMLTDNCLSYTYLMAPLAVMVGVSLRSTQA